MVSLGCEDFIGGKFIDGIWRAPSRVGLGVVFRVESFDESTVPVFFLFLNSVERLGCCLPAAGCDSWSACCVSAGDSTREKTVLSLPLLKAESLCQMRDNILNCNVCFMKWLKL